MRPLLRAANRGIRMLMQGKRLGGLAIFLQLACSGRPVRDFGTGEAGSGGANTGGAAVDGRGGALGSGGRGGSLGSGGSAAGAGMCAVDLECASQPHVRAGAPAKCTNGKCSIPESSCETGFGHCSSSEVEFCETSLTTTANCGGCGKACPSASPLCMNGECVSTCTSAKPYTCSGSCVDTASDPANCGACGTSCLLPNADITCDKGVCSSPVCKAGYGDCTSSPGCETLLNTLSDCGACNQKCGASGDIASCSTGTCSLSCTNRPEECFNSKDDDCDGQIDCADSDCSGPAQCVPSATWAYGTAIAAGGACPAGFNGNSSEVHGVLSGGSGCSGCGCNPTTTDCAPYTIWLWSQCVANPTVVTTINVSQASAGCTAKSTNPWSGVHWAPTPKPNCENIGTASPSKPTWTDEGKFCGSSLAGAGCAAGNVCVPTAPGTACLLANGSLACPSQFPKQRALYTAFSDTRVCSCSCRANGGDCDAIQLSVSFESSDCSINPTAVPQNGSLCTGGNATYNQISYSIYGTETAPTSCTPSNVSAGGSLTPTGPQTLCCQ